MINVSFIAPDVNPDPGEQDKERLRDAARKKSPVVNRRVALGMAFKQAFSAVQGAKDKAASAVSAAGDKLGKAGERREPPGPKARD